MADKPAKSQKVKVKEFSLIGAKIYCAEQSPLSVNPYYRKKPHMRYISVIPSQGNPIKISSSCAEKLRPVHEGISRVLEATQKIGNGHMVAAVV